MEKPWLRQYPEGVPATVDLTQYASMVTLLEDSFSKYAERDAYVCMGRALTYGAWDKLSLAFAGWLQSRGLAKGDRVAVMMPNLPQYPIAVAAILRAGCVVVNVNPLYTPRELEHQLADSGARAIIILDMFVPTLAKVLEKTAVTEVVVSSVTDSLQPGAPAPAEPPAGGVIAHAVRFPAAVMGGFALPFTRPELALDDIAVLQYTGGTTGVSKGAVLLHKTIIANLQSAESWMHPGLKRRPATGQMNVVCALPLYHVFAFITCALLGARAGGVNILIPNPRDMDGMIAQLKPYKINVFPAVNTLFNGLIHHPGFAELDFSELAISNGGGMAVQEAVARRWLEVTGCPICEGYGLTETSSGITCNRTDSEEFTGTVGLPLPGVEVAILDDEGLPVAAGSPGEIAIRGPQVMAGYWMRPDETAKVITADGFFKSGDIGIMDERGYFRIVDRKKDMILVSGFNVFPNEIEGVAVMHPGVLEAAAVGVPDDKCGEAVKLFVVKHDPELTEAALAAFLTEQLTGYKRPKFIEFRTELPKSPVGKILRRELR